MATKHVFDLLETADSKAGNIPLEGVCAVFGSERFLQQLATAHLVALIGGTDSDMTAGRYQGDTAEWADVSDELHTLSLFGGGGPRIAVVDHADPFVSRNRDRIERLVDAELDNALLIIVVDKWAANTKLYKLLDKQGLQINCNPPKTGKSVDSKRIAGWLVERAKSEYDFNLPKAGANLLMQLTESEFGRMDQELCKLSLYVDDKKKIAVEKIPGIIGGQKLESMWTAVDRAVAGEPAEAIKVIHQLIQGGDAPLALFGQVSWALRRIGKTGELVARQQRLGERVNLDAILKQSGFRTWGNEIEKMKSSLRQLGRQRVYAMYQWLLDAELELKGSHSRNERAQLVLEKLMVKMASELNPA